MKRMLGLRTLRQLSAVLLVLTARLPHHTAQRATDYNQIKRLFDTISVINKFYIREVPAEKLMQGAITGMLQTLDPGCSYVSPEIMKELKVNPRVGRQV